MRAWNAMGGMEEQTKTCTFFKRDYQHYPCLQTDRQNFISQDGVIYIISDNDIHGSQGVLMLC